MRSALQVATGACLWLALAVASAAGSVTGRVVGITDGDTLRAVVDGVETRIRLAEIDTPERGQPWGTKAKDALAALAFGKMIRIVVVDVDRYGRTVAKLYVGRRYINAEMVRAGNAWVYRKYSRDPALLDMEAEARAARRGLWALPEADKVPPWEWRRR